MRLCSVPDGVKVATVSELTQAVKSLLEDGFSSVWVEGEISNLARPNSGHVYLSLKDSRAQLRAVIWRSIALRLRFDPRDGQEIIARGRLTVYPPRGDYQLTIEELHPKGIGAQELALRQLKEKLLRLGYFDPGRKRPLPRLPRCVGLVTSATGAAIRDILEIFGRRWPAVEVLVSPVRVQGEGAPAEIASALRLFSRLRCADVVILGRGGGSAEDLWAFNEEIVARAVFESMVPVVAAIGHEVDVTIADLVADRRALTPSEAAELVVPSRDELLEVLRRHHRRLRELVAGRVATAWQRWRDLAERQAFRLPLDRVRDQERRLDEWQQRLDRSVSQRLARGRQAVEGWAGRLQALSPLNVLSRGYSLTQKDGDARVVRHATQVVPGDRLVTLVQSGRIISRVEATDAAHLSPPADNTDPTTS
jgi:exodeoxyribonuclease VII large subunit